MPGAERLSFDHAALLERLEGDVRLADSVIRSYLAEGPAMVAELQAAVAGRDASRVEYAAHRLRGALATVAAPAASAMCEDIEDAARDGDRNAATAQLDALHDELKRLAGALERCLLDVG